jgi:hypothetical protein
VLTFEFPLLVENEDQGLHFAEAAARARKQNERDFSRSACFLIAVI